MTSLAREVDTPSCSLLCLSRGHLEHFRAKWTPVRVKKMRQNKDPEPFSDSTGSENAPKRFRAKWELVRAASMRGNQDLIAAALLLLQLFIPVPLVSFDLTRQRRVSIEG
jgi:hypothetical protein